VESAASIDSFGATRVESGGAFRAKIASPSRLLDLEAQRAHHTRIHAIYDMVYVAVAEAARTTLITADATPRSRLAHLAWISGPDA
jgi:hypothetical protein